LAEVVHPYIQHNEMEASSRYTGLQSRSERWLLVSVDERVL
jgi:hypothetical protein